MRSIKMVQGEHRSKDILCDRCGRKPICGHYARGRRQQRRASHPSCKGYIPVLKFKKPHKGFEGNFNTFRHGKAWLKRAQVGTILGLVDADTELVFGYARITSIIVGDKQEMEAAHGRKNHAMRDAPEMNDVEFTEQFIKLRKRNSGNMIYNNAKYATVLYMTRLYEIDAVSEEKFRSSASV